MVDVDRARAALTELLESFGLDPDEHTAGTPLRAAKAWDHMLAGYNENPADHLATTFPVVGDPGLVLITGIEVHSTCAHHLLPITGLATVAYRPSTVEGRVVGLSKLSRVVDGYARRLQVQEQLGSSVVAALDDRLWPIGAACIITAEHGCMTIRGVQQAGTTTTTHSWGGSWSDNPAHPDRAAVLAAHLGSLGR